jgi:hypothetical protein
MSSPYLHIFLFPNSGVFARVHAEMIGAIQEEAFGEYLSVLISKSLADGAQLARSQQDDSN